MGAFHALATLLDDMKYTITGAHDFGTLAQMTHDLSDHLIASLTPKHHKKEGLNLKELGHGAKLVKVDKKALKYLLI